MTKSTRLTPKQQQALLAFHQALRAATTELTRSFPLRGATTWCFDPWQIEPVEPDERGQFVSVSVRVGDGRRVYSTDLSLI